MTDVPDNYDQAEILLNLAITCKFKNNNKIWL